MRIKTLALELLKRSHSFSLLSSSEQSNYLKRVFRKKPKQEMHSICKQKTI